MVSSPRGLTDSFVDHLARMVQLIAQAKLSPDSDPNFLTQLENIIINYIKGSPSTPNPPPSGGTMGPPQQISPVPMPVVPGGAPPGVTPNPDMSGLVSELQGMQSA